MSPSSELLSNLLRNERVSRDNTQRSGIDPNAIEIQGVEWWKRRIPKSRGRHLTGYATTWERQPLLHVESRLEHGVIRAFADSPACLAIATQPVTIRFKCNRKTRTYTPDILVGSIHFGRAKYFFVEVKPQQFVTELSEDLAVRRAAVHIATRLPLLVVTEVDLANNRSETAR